MILLTLPAELLIWMQYHENAFFSLISFTFSLHPSYIVVVFFSIDAAVSAQICNYLL